MEKGALLAQHPNHLDRIATLPEQMAQVAVGSDLFTHSLAQLQQRHRIVDDKTGMHFQRQLVYPVSASEFSRLLPIWNDFLLTLPIQNLCVLGRPAISSPIRHRLSRVAARTSGKTNNNANSQPVRQQHRTAN